MTVLINSYRNLKTCITIVVLQRRNGSDSLDTVVAKTERAMNDSDSNSHESKRLAHPVRLPGFIADEDVGLGDVVKRMTYAVGIKPCGGCEQRAAALNRWLTFSGKRK